MHLNSEDIDRVLRLVEAELVKATRKFGPFRSTHEGYAILLEEVDEMWDAIKANDSQHACEEAKQVAAMACRFMLDVPGIDA